MPRTRPSRSRFRRLPAPALAAALLTLVVLGITMVVAPDAQGYLSTHGFGASGARVGTLAAPTSVTASASGTSVSVNWSAASAPVGGAVTGYSVERFSGPTPTAACGSSSASLLSASTISCTDSGNPSGAGVPEGTYTYEVIAVWRSWSATSSASSPVSVLAPSVTSTAPAAGDQGATGFNVSVNGTNFVAGATTSFGPGITVNSTTFVSATQLTANITIASGAAIGSRTVTVTNPDGDVASGSVFAVGAAPTVTSASPGAADQGSTNLSVAIAGTGFDSGAQLGSSFGAGITVNSTTFLSATQLSASITIAPNAATGSRTVTITNGDASTAALSGAFTVNGAPTFASVSPSAEDDGGSQTVTITGTNFESGASISISGAGVTTRNITYLSATSLTATVAVSATATTGARNLTVTNPDGTTATGAGAFTINAAPTVVSASPASGDDGGSQTVTITGTNFESGATISLSGIGITLSNVTYLSANTLTATVALSASATTGARSLTVTNPDGTAATRASAFTVNGPPTVASASPSSRGQGASAQSITITGTNFESGASVSFSASGITVNSTTFNSATKLTAKITIAPGATTGACNVTVTNPDNTTAAGTGVFIVDTGPTVSSLSPSSEDRGGSQTVTITGSDFVSGVTVSFSGSGVTASNITYINATTLTATVAVTAAAGTTSRNVTVTNPDAGTATASSLFKVNAVPTVVSTSPSAGARGATLNVTITGTNFESGAAATFSGTGIAVNSTTFTSATSLTANITVASGATAGAVNVTVTNPDGTTATGTGVFTVS